ncbi:MAG: 3-oxoacyl-ACP reductase family protein [Desulfobacterales bacterium]|jgi:2-deoxy-D-gluconate 3-dehydrogenase|nr:3-oxoacyl-ACP reductase FabG [Desulfobacterales bacterium]
MAIDIDLKGKVAVVTGAGRGIGKAIAIALAEAGADVVLAARTAAQLEKTAKEIRSKGCQGLPVPTDVTRKEEVDRLMSTTIDQLGCLHILVNNASIMAPASLIEQTEDDWDKVMAVNLKAYFLCTQAAGRCMIEQKYGKIINMASTGGVIAGPKNASYHSSKAAIIHFTRSVAIEWIKYNINVNAVGPGVVDTELVDQFLQKGSRDLMLKGVPIKRFADPEEIANLVVFLASDLAGYIVGEHVIIDGGLTIP